MEVLALISQRLSLAEIANALVFSVSTAKSHTHNIYSKLGVRNGRQAVNKARKMGILPLE
jgi:LuxR family maltose regulon positive regulatory protein